MSGRRRVTAVTVVWAAWALSLFGLGCQAQVSYQFVNPFAPKSAELADDDEKAPGPKVKAAEWAGKPNPDVVKHASAPEKVAAKTAVKLVSAEEDGPAVGPRPAEAGQAPAPLAADASQPPPGPDGACPAVPTEMQKLSHPPYMIEPPDILFIDTIRMIPRPPYVVQPMDVLLIRVADALPNQPIDGTYTVSPDGSINLGFSYGTVRVGGQSLQQAEEAIRRALGRVLTSPQVAVGLSQYRAVQQTRGEHLVRQDGTVSLGTYGCVYVAGLTLAEAKCAIERHLSRFVQDPEIALDVFAYNSKVYYVIYDGAGFGQQVFRLPITGNETVLDAISSVNGLSAVASKKRIWVARPAPCNNPCVQVLPVDWRAITMAGSTCTNYQIFPGDRIYVAAQPIITINNTIAKIVAPVEQLFGVTLLGAATVNTIRTNPNNNNNNGVNGVIVPGF
ncbi:MAG TPA: polysaccharide biosynthesis/export family protein [Gemmataceae bacterium]|jgi:polysaccharide export outer membrane protein|nr:polysaccharide biosynthesis/export family protein [Gemmataceae bacterium]